MTTIVWLRRDLRLHDNPALNAASSLGEPVLPVFNYAPEEEQPWAPGAASRWYLHKSLQKLQKSLQLIGLDLELDRGPSSANLIKIAKRIGAKRIYWNQLFEPAIATRDQQVQRELSKAGIESKICHDYSLVRPGDVTKPDGKAYRVFTPFWRRLSPKLQQLDRDFNLLEAPRINPLQKVAAHHTDLLMLEITDAHSWSRKLDTYWNAGETDASERLERFIPRAHSYVTQRDFPATEGTSKLSAALHFGEISPWRILSHLRKSVDQHALSEFHEDIEPFVRQLAWREFAIHLLHQFPHSSDNSLDPRFEDSNIWFYDEEAIAAWQKGETGSPLVDAGMQELWETGYMHNRVRMIVGSVLTKNLGQHWIHGAKWFWDTLVDANLANNSMGWQWVAGSGCDAAPYFRIFNPDTQAKKFDTEGRYLGKWLKSPMSNTIPIDLSTTRQSALMRYAEMKK